MGDTLRLLIRRAGRVLILASLVGGGLAAGAGPALAVWSASGSGSASGAANTMPAGSTPSVTLSGSNVTVRWSAATLPGGTDVAGYIVNRYDAVTGAPATVGAACSGIVTSTSCTESAVPDGSWVYTDTPVQVNWTGQESPQSSTVTISPLTTTSPLTTLKPPGRVSPPLYPRKHGRRPTRGHEKEAT